MDARRLLIWLAWLSPAVAEGLPADDREVWIRPQAPGEALIWGRKDGLVFGLPSPGGMRGPRGLIRTGIWNSTTKQAELINFIAVEPVVVGLGSRQSRMAFSELEKGSDGKQGKILIVPDAAGKLETIS